ncbi:methionine--tRNA ligase [Streptococcus pneumoniae]|nr:methionine--tRNA ligase [Streptococcus pneumoniae]VJZ86705.1 methionine--tRNA ligase [Streptococcus pneumoniae]VRU36454.1 methionine--tRNA ligase [Streptococcus pneumoniae]VRV45996.1 methionine--tRNA ligase [Streptococcus pneumoniae]VRW57342.1 methionine--tRNA ligase [Streptococcus pneumoniae]
MVFRLGVNNWGFLINVSGEGEGFSMWSPTACDVLATDWVEVHD